MLNIPSEELPKKFTNNAGSKGPVQILSKAPAASAKVLVPSSTPQEDIDDHVWDSPATMSNRDTQPGES